MTVTSILPVAFLLIVNSLFISGYLLTSPLESLSKIIWVFSEVLRRKDIFIALGIGAH